MLLIEVPRLQSIRTQIIQRKELLTSRIEGCIVSYLDLELFDFFQVEYKPVWGSEHKRGPARRCWELHVPGNQ